MDAVSYRWQDMPEDNPVPSLYRRRIAGEQMLVARVRLQPGCLVAEHSHASEQTAIVLSGRVRWTLGKLGSDERYEQEMSGGEVLHLPSNVPHGLIALEETEIIDILSPPGPMGIDSQGR